MQIKKLDDASSVSKGYPHDFNNTLENRMVLTGGKIDKIEKPKIVVL
jgi:hypothetical protein